MENHVILSCIYSKDNILSDRNKVKQNLSLLLYDVTAKELKTEEYK
jgi:hypothetical protein